VSRIQDILAKAEREGMTRRTQAEPSLTPPPPLAAPVIAPVTGTAALDTTPFLPPADPGTVARGLAPAAVPDRVRPVSSPAAEPRTGRATLHPALIAAIAPQSLVAERYRAVRTRLTMQEENGPLRTILVTSAGRGDGKSITAANLSLTMAQEFQRNVVLVDANLRGPAVHALFGLDASPGLSDVLAGDATLDEALVYLPDYRLTILPAGRPPQFPAELLGSTAMRRSIDTLRARFDRILIDLPGVSQLADAGTMAPLADGVVMVVRAGVTQRPALDDALAVFEEDKLLGIVLNDAQ
jgi:capsular exopolysaccharide synthesis family protein